MREKRGFTLVELLVVIGIIALLISILLPTLSKAREVAQRIKCSSNMRQIGIAMTMYTGENRDFYPWAEVRYMHAGSVVVKTWDDLLNRYLGGNASNEDIDATHLPDPIGTLQCPSDDVPREKTADFSAAWGVHPRSYALLRSFGYDPVRGLRFRGAGGAYRSPTAMNWTALGPFMSAKRSWYQSSTEKIILAERPVPNNVLGGLNAFFDYPIDHWSSFAEFERRGAGARHGMNFNYLCHDGHVETQPVEILLPPLNRAREVARPVMVSSSLRTITQSIVIYENAHKTFIPGITPIYGEPAPASDKDEYQRP